MAKEHDLGNSKLTLGKANGEAMLPAETKNLLEVIHVGGEVLGEDQDIVQVDKTDGNITQNKVHHALKGVSSVLKPKRHPQKFEHSKGSNDGSLLNVLEGHRNLIISFLKVQLGEHSCARFPGSEVSNIWKRIPIRNRHIIQPPVISTRPPSSLLLTNHVERRRPGSRAST